MRSFECIERPGTPATAVLLHPHPDMGGDRFHPVITSLYQGLPVSTCRFDFSSSSIGPAHDQVLAAIERAGGPVVLIGYSFGADIALTVDQAQVLGWFLIAPPLRVVDPAAMVAGPDPRPKRLAVAQYDQFCPPERAAAMTSEWAATTLVTIAGSDHFLVGHSEPVLDAVRAWLRDVLGARHPNLAPVDADRDGGASAPPRAADEDGDALRGPLLS